MKEVAAVLRRVEIYPIVVNAGKQTEMTIRAIDRTFFEADSEYDAHILPLLETAEGRAHEWGDKPYDRVQLTRNGNLFTFSYNFNREQEYYVRIYKRDDLECRHRIASLRIYAVDDDLYCRFPYKGDMHIHSNYSDGKEAPEIVCANYRRAGFDFMGLTDHGCHYSSLLAINAYAGVKLGMLLCKGEEVHPPRNHIHTVNFGGNESVNEYFRENKADYEKEVAEIEAKLDLPDNVCKYAYASVVWAYNKIRECGGLAIFPHPYWLANVYHVDYHTTVELLKNKPFDAYELLGGLTHEENHMQVALYNELRSQGYCKDMPVIGSSDSHGTIGSEIFNVTKTYVFAKDLTWESIRDAIVNGYCVAVEDSGDKANIHGKYRLVSFAQFLNEVYFPTHDEICFEEGRLMVEYANGCKDAETLLNLMSNRTKELLNKSYGK